MDEQGEKEIRVRVESPSDFGEVPSPSEPKQSLPVIYKLLLLLTFVALGGSFYLIYVSSGVDLSALVNQAKSLAAKIQA